MLYVKMYFTCDPMTMFILCWTSFDLLLSCFYTGQLYTAEEQNLSIKRRNKSFIDSRNTRIFL